MVILLKIKRRDFFNDTAFLFWCHALLRLGRSNCCIFEMKHATGMEACTEINFLFILNLVYIGIPRYYDFKFGDVTVKTIYRCPLALIRFICLRKALILPIMIYSF